MGIILNKLTSIKVATKVLPISIKNLFNIAKKEINVYFFKLNLYLFFNLLIDEKAGISPSKGRGAGN